jgi:hypothetical protein
MNQQGYYIQRLLPGAYDLTVQGDHYNAKQEHMVINSDLSLSFDLQTRIQTGDIDRNEEQDIGDAIQCLQIISGFDVGYYYDPAALTGKVLELRDVIFILQKLSEMK